MGIIGALNMTLQKIICLLLFTVLLIFFKCPNFDNFKAIPDKRTVWMSNVQHLTGSMAI